MNRSLTQTFWNRFGRLACLAVLCGILSSAAPLFAQDAAKPDPRAEYIRSHYGKYEYQIAMRDGTKLFTAIYVPNDKTRRYPVMLLRTPYAVGPYGSDRYKTRLAPSEEFEKAGYIFVFQDVRGRFMSEGTYVNMRPHQSKKSGQQFDESSDTYDTIEWVVKNIEVNNGKVGQWGISYPGFYTAAGAIDSHPALKAVSPQAPIADWFWDDMHRHGAFVLPLAFNFFSSFGVARESVTSEWPERFDHRTADGYQFFLELGPLKNVNEKYFKGEIDFWNKLAEHPNYDSFWQSRNLLPHLKNINAAVMTVGGWFDTEDLYGPLQIYRSIEEKNPGTDNTLVMGPWSHGQWNRGSGEKLGSAEWGFATAEWYRENIQFAFFEHHLRDGEAPPLPEALMFETGANRWREFESWPPKAAQPVTLYFNKDGALTGSPPSADATPAFDEYPSDPAKPVPYTQEITTRWARNYMTEDQRFAAWRPDVLVYETEPMAEDRTIAGEVIADLWVSTTGTDADFIVKVIDVYPGELPLASGRDDSAKKGYPGGRQMLVRAEAMRARFRESYETPIPMVAGEKTRVRFRLNDVLHTFKRGHRMMVQVQSTWFPFIDRNPQNYVENIFEADEDDFTKATHRVYRSHEHASKIELQVLPKP